MKLIILILISTYLLSINNYKEGSILCVSEDGFEIEMPLQVCEHHAPDNDSIQEDHCTDHEIQIVKTFKAKYKLKFINKITKVYYELFFKYETYDFKISLKDELKNKINFNKLNPVSDPILKQIKTIIILT